MLNHCKHNLWRAYVDFLFDNDKYWYQGQSAKTILYLWPKWPKSAYRKLIPYLWAKQPKNHTLWSRTYLYCSPGAIPKLFTWESPLPLIACSCDENNKNNKLEHTTNQQKNFSYWIALIAVISGLTCRGKKINSALYWPFSLICIPF